MGYLVKERDRETEREREREYFGKKEWVFINNANSFKQLAIEFKRE